MEVPSVRKACARLWGIYARHPRGIGTADAGVENGTIEREGDPEALRGDEYVRTAYLGGRATDSTRGQGD